MVIDNLEKQISSEKDYRLKLEQEVDVIKKMNAEICSKLGIPSSINSKEKK